MALTPVVVVVVVVVEERNPEFEVPEETAIHREKLARDTPDIPCTVRRVDLTKGRGYGRELYRRG